jgi:hypothetical protein
LRVELRKIHQFASEAAVQRRPNFVEGQRDTG